ncbi:adenosine deaminase [Nakamurella leprariae]|uniref:adenosine deaminase n=1 Tax=Nakamurella leprariae TaxID=2803911 RepID=A0A938YBK2_9ACTN|nr:adenosine deaminase [Nakamurella leprariae]MBM9466804.1 adenosine deaminase [Nakamurella leprariae]
MNQPTDLPTDLPINLHSHLEGRVRPDTAADLAAALGLATPPGGWTAALTLPGPDTLTTYLDRVGASYPFFTDPDAIARVTSEAVQDAAADGQAFLELRFGPGTHARATGRAVDDVVAAACEGLIDGMERAGMPAGLVLAALRSHDDDTNLAVARSAARFAGAGVVGFDLAGDERRFPALERYRPAFAVAAAAGLGLTCHAAEAAPAAAAQEAVERFGVTRIGHGAHVAADPVVLAWLVDRGVVVEVCPTSNWYTGAIPTVEAHPAATFRRAGVPLVLGDDNPVQTGSPLSAERRVLAEQLGVGPDGLAEVDRTSVTALFADDSVRAALAARLPG